MSAKVSIPKDNASPCCCPIVELRQYTLRPRKRDVLIRLFEREFIETQEAAGMRVIGQFRDADNPNRFVWLRGFPDMESRAQALTDFYTGPVWKKHREAANATMIDSDNVLLLRPARPTSGFVLRNDRDSANGETISSLVVANVYYLEQPADGGFVEFFDQTISPILTENGASLLSYLVTESRANTFPALPVRENEHVFVCFSAFSDGADYDRHLAALARSSQWTTVVAEGLSAHLSLAPEILRLRPTSRSLLRGVR